MAVSLHHRLAGWSRRRVYMATPTTGGEPGQELMASRSDVTAVGSSIINGMCQKQPRSSVNSVHWWAQLSAIDTQPAALVKYSDFWLGYRRRHDQRATQCLGRQYTRITAELLHFDIGLYQETTSLLDQITSRCSGPGTSAQTAVSPQGTAPASSKCRSGFARACEDF